MKTAIFLLLVAITMFSGCVSSLMPYDDNFECRLSKKEKGMCGTMGQVHKQIIKDQEGEQ